MPLDPHAKRLLDMLAMTGSVDALCLSVNDRRDLFRKLMSLSASNVPIGGIEDRTLPGPGGPINIRVYTPIATLADRLPGLVYFHGGGLVAGSLDTHDSLCKTLANETGCRLISVDYRLAPEHKFPAAIMDGYTAAIWAVEHATELGIDRDRIAVAGDSAGATLAAIVCQLARRAQRAHLAAQLLLCPITDYAKESGSRSDFADGYLLDRAMMDRDREYYLPAGTDPTDPRISPLRASELSGLPPAYVHTAEFDPLLDEGRSYADKLARAGVKVNYTCHAGMIHLFFGMDSAIPYARTALKRIGSELRAGLG
jgi:acetyl esterase/lipase